MLYALRKLIAFVFLGGIFWFIYQDLGNLGKPWFMHSLAVLVLIFAVFWLIVPEVVVHLRIRRRRQQNAARHVAWRETLGPEGPQPLPRQTVRLALEAGELLYAHEKGTLYVEPGAGLNEISVRGVPGDVAFPGLRRLSRKIQRTHFYLTDRRIILAGKSIDRAFPLADLPPPDIMPGGLRFRVTSDRGARTFAFTFQNPPIMSDLLRLVAEKGRRSSGRT